MPDYNAFAAFSKECNAHYRELLDFEYKKMDMIHNDDLESLSKMLAEEQALVMKSNSLEKKREKLLSNGDSGKTFRDIISEAPEQYKAALIGDLEELTELIRTIKELNDHAAVIINERLKKMQNRRGELDTYNVSGSVSHTDNSVRHTTFNA